MIRKRDFSGEVAKVEEVISDFILSFVKRNIKTLQGCKKEEDLRANPNGLNFTR